MISSSVIPFFLLLLLLFAGCETSDYLEDAEAFQITRNGELVLDLSDIELYDFSTHILYLNENNRLNGDFDQLNGATVTVDGQELYTLRIQEPNSSAIHPGPQIFRKMDTFGDFAFRIRFVSLTDGTSTPHVDPRENKKIRDALKRHGKLREGLALEILSVESQGSLVKTKVRLRNIDSFSYYHLDPVKMGNGLFHFYTNGLSFFNPAIKSYIYDQSVAQSPEPWNYWTKEWLSEIQPNESKDLVFTYNLGTVPAGQELRFSFDFPSPELSIKNRNDLYFKSSRIWLGSVGDTKVVRF